MGTGQRRINPRLFRAGLALLVLASVCLTGVSRAATYFSPRVDYDASLGPYTVAIGDLNNDAIPDLAVVYDFADSLSVYFGKGDGTFEDRKNSHLIDGAHDLVIGNFNNDVWPDIAVIETSGRLAICIGDGTGIFPNPLYPSIGPGSGGKIAAGQLNHDSNLDLVVTNYQVPGAFYVLLGNGDGTFQPYVEHATRNRPGGIVLGDFIENGFLDIAIAYDYCCPDDNTATIFRGGGMGDFAPGMDMTVCTGPTSIATGDINQDGRLDFVTACANDSASVRLGLGDGTFVAAPSIQIGQGYPAVTLADVTGDGTLDVAIALRVFFPPDSVRVFPGVGNGNFDPMEKLETGSFPNGIAAGDLNGDGHVDLVTANAESDLFPPAVDGSISVHLNCVPCGTAISVALQDATVEAGVVHLRWVVPTTRGAVFSVFRRTAGTGWIALPGDVGLSEGLVTYDDNSAAPGERYAYRLLVRSSGDQGYSSEVWVSVPTSAAPMALRLDPVYPNPFGARTNLGFAVPTGGPARLAIYTVAGRKVVTIVDQIMPSGWRLVEWDGRDASDQPVASGTYFAKLESAGQVQVRKIIVAR